MRKWLGNLLIIILCIVLTVNVLRVFFVNRTSDGTYSTVSIWTVFNAISEFKVDSSYLYEDFAKGASLLSSCGNHFSSAFKKSTYESSNISVLTNLVRFFTCIMKSFEDAYTFLYTFAFLIGDVFKFVFNFMTAFFKFMNKVLGSIFSTVETAYPNTPGGGGFGGRR